jgi:hypothetical protein
VILERNASGGRDLDLSARDGGVGTAAALCAKAWVGSPPRTMPATGRPQGLSLGFDGCPADALLWPAGSPVWSPDGNLIAATVPRDGVHCARGENLVILDAQTGNVVTKAAVPAIAAIGGWSADERYCPGRNVPRCRNPAPGLSPDGQAANCGGLRLRRVGSGRRALRGLVQRAPRGDRRIHRRTYRLRSFDLRPRRRRRVVVGRITLRRHHSARVRARAVEWSDERDSSRPLRGGFVVGFAKNGRVLVQAFNRTAGR